MADRLEETHFDAIVLGTGLVESIVAGSLSRAGKKVLHLDSNEQYGSSWSVFGFKQLLDWKALVDSSKQDRKEADGLAIRYAESYASSFKDVSINLGTNGKIGGVAAHSTNDDDHEDASVDQEQQLLARLSASDKAQYVDQWKSTLSAMGNDGDRAIYLAQLAVLVDCLASSRQYNLDTCPKLLTARGQLVEDLIRSGVGRYMEFKSVDDMFVYDHAEHALKKVPGSKEDVFTNKTISLVDKRKLMKFLTFAMSDTKDETLLEGHETLSYTQFLESKFKITGRLQSAVVHAISLSRSDVSAVEGLARTQVFLASMGRFGRGAYLCTMYGGGSEIAQAFCRICAVFGGIYILAQKMGSFVVDDSDATGVCKGITTADGQQFTADHIITGYDYLPRAWQGDAEHAAWISKAMIVSSKPLAQFTNAGSELVTYLTTRSDLSTLKQAVADMVSSSDDPEQQDAILFDVIYQQRSRHRDDVQAAVPRNVQVCSDPDATLDFDSAVLEARAIFAACMGDDDALFMPPPPEEPEAADDYQVDN
ncbi:GDP dissociation inhibitor-domain-containing protein [Gongronella butleri]|nr:GDP dissociation inhibitor-domain-containing protein [Gongronella butleri]